MTPDERQLITDLFDRMRNLGGVEKDREAESVIAAAVRAQPGAPYLLVQSVLVQDQALQDAQAHIQSLEARIAELERGPKTASTGAGSFLGGRGAAFGGQGAAAQRSGSVPPIGSRAGVAADPGPWAGGSPSQPRAQAGIRTAPQAPATTAGGGFMKTAMATAAGVAGGALLFDGLKGMFGGGASTAQASTAQPATQDPGADQQAANARQDAEQDDDISEYEQAADDSGDWDSGGWDSDIDI